MTRHIAGAIDQFLAVLPACVLAEEETSVWCEPRILIIQLVSLSQFIFPPPHQFLALIFLNCSPFLGTTYTYMAVLRRFCLVEVLPFLLSGKVLSTVLHVPSQVASIMVFLAPQGKLILFAEFFLMWTIFKSLYWICYNIASISCFVFFWSWVMWNLSSPTSDWTRSPLHCKANSQPLDCQRNPWTFTLWHYSICEL